MTKKYRVDMLTEESVSIITQQYANIEDEYLPIGGIHRKAYINSIKSRNELVAEVPQAQVNAVLAVWGDKPLTSE